MFTTPGLTARVEILFFSVFSSFVLNQSLDVTLCLGILCASLSILRLNLICSGSVGQGMLVVVGAPPSHTIASRSCHKHRRCIPAKEVWRHGWPNSPLGCG